MLLLCSLASAADRTPLPFVNEITTYAYVGPTIAPDTVAPHEGFGGTLGVKVDWRVLTASVNAGWRWQETLGVRAGLRASTGFLEIAAGAGYAFDDPYSPQHSSFGWFTISCRPVRKKGSPPIGVTTRAAEEFRLYSDLPHVSQLQGQVHSTVVGLGGGYVFGVRSNPTEADSAVMTFAAGPTFTLPLGRQLSD